MTRKENAKVNKPGERVLKALELPRDIILGMPKITIIGDSEIVIENYKGIIDYENEVLKINTEPGVITVEGAGFNISAITDDEIEIEGKIAKIDFSF